MNEGHVGYYLAWAGTAAWGVCFWWMHRISSRQDALLAELREQTQRIEELSRMEHDILKEVHPDVNEIKASVEEVSQDLADVRRDNIAQAVVAEQVLEQVAHVEAMVATAAPEGDSKKDG